jgi:hypothetical protein
LVAQPGPSSIGISISGTFVATIQFAASIGGAAFSPLRSLPLSGSTLVNSTTTTGEWTAEGANLFQVCVYASAYTSGTASVVIDQSQGSPRSPGTGRTFIVLGADGVTPAISDTVITFAKNVNGAVTGSQTTYAITAGKTLRIQSICASLTAGAAANRVAVRVRLNTGGACVAGSGLLLPAFELAPNYGTATAAEGGASGCMTIPDGLELSGTNWNICLSESATAASGTLTAALVGFEY